MRRTLAVPPHSCPRSFLRLHHSPPRRPRWGRLYRIGYLATTPRQVAGPPLGGAPEMGCGSAGITKGRTSSSSGRFSEGDAVRFPAFAAEMVQLRVDLVIAITTPAALAVTPRELEDSGSS